MPRSRILLTTWHRLSHGIGELAQRLRDSLWFVPALIVLGFAALASAMVEISSAVPRELLQRLPRLFGADAESSRAMLAAVAGSIITVAGVTFSITVVVVSQASSQFTPRILRNFLRDRPSQVALGVLVGVFVYCLAVMRTIRGDSASHFIPSLAVLTGIVLGVIGVGFLVYFLHHIATSLDAGTIIDRVRRETDDAIDRLYPQELGEGSHGEEASSRRATDAPNEWYAVASASTGYIQRINSAALLSTACECDALLRIERGVGEFVVKGSALVWVAGRPLDDELASALRGFFTIDTYRTVQQDVAFGIRQLVDIALKALSPGVNDSTTAAMCVDQLGALLVKLAGRRLDRLACAEYGRWLLVFPEPTFETLTDAAFNEIRRNASSNVHVLTRVLDALERIAAVTRSMTRLNVLATHADRVVRAARAGITLAQDQPEVLAAYGHAMRAIEAALGPIDCRTDQPEGSIPLE